MSRRHQSDGERMLVAIKKVDVQPVISEFYHNPLWLLAALVLFVVIGNIFEVLWMILRDLKRFLFRIFRSPKRFLRRHIKSIKDFFSKRYGKNRSGSDRKARKDR